MKAVTYQGKKEIAVKEVEAPKIQDAQDVIVKITSTAICGSDLHLYQGNFPLPIGYIIGHEPMGIVEDIGPEVTKVKKGDRVVIPFTVACGSCPYCDNHLESQCDNSNPHYDSGGLFGYSEKFGNYPGGQAEYLRVPFGNYTPFVIPESCELEDEKLLFLSDVLPTAYWSVENAGVKKGDTVIVLGCGPVGLMAQKFAWQKGAERVIAIDYFDYRLNHSKKMNKTETFDFTQYDDMGETLKELTKGGADVVIDCVGMDGKKSPLEYVEQKLKLQGGTMGPIQIATKAVRKCGTVQLTGVYGGLYNMFPLGPFFSRNVTLKMGQAHARSYMPKMYEQIIKEEIDPTQIITHTLPLEKASHGYDIFNNKQDNCIKVVLKP
ncbi:zinc-dependent alcohol dehydrogenase [Priestia endophytica]|jgi:S-(hydroxymethyl)glutathione dehydrogenase/alcohol dehydrogenase|uniref:S-(Hydroxymethyl)glutathione dehydrogenase / alcohol dehydrogenase n=1 Tax=Priestia endophytica DSM 13796 TaxID=1121089 RepID=A0A1I5Y5N8_9BACI|nr:zinc-dependent alcohol dehydrogenase [Priestia endophytica]KAB2496038.1 glutathione-dependent formaldehyde dehydrogenase [Priestia endophytica]KYG31575.1 glutathione-dependent formaldehyde dehydrogenase [Priestia endophytica]MBG9811561.1 dehydrogenase [Priestia endophytica]SFQ39410.1 S-(hydroxymethyl)glutathione dehydrogenase / alcohol dehydrogenase [Priestia endophytica DSM 13796]